MFLDIQRMFSRQGFNSLAAQNMLLSTRMLKQRIREHQSSMRYSKVNIPVAHHVIEFWIGLIL